MSATAELVQFAFDGDLIDCAKVDGRVRISVSRICENLGIDRKGQQAKLQTKAWATGELISLVAADGRRRDVYCLDLDALPMWLATIEPGRVKEELRDKLVAYQKKAALVLRDHFIGAPPPAPLPAPTPRLSGGDDNGEKLLAVIQVMAQQQQQYLADRAAQQQTAAVAAQADQRSQTAIAKVDRLIAENQAAELVLETPPRAPKVLAPDVTSQVLTGRIVRAYGMLTRDYQGGWNIVYLNHRDTYHIDIKQLAKNDGVTPAEKATELERWEYLYAMAVKYLSPKIAEIRAARMSVARSYNA